jgi:hypothetical protein
MTLSDELIRVLLADDHAVVRAGLKAESTEGAGSTFRFTLRIAD